MPARFYTDPVVADAERENVFRKSWQLVGRADQCASSGDYFTAEVGGAPIVIVRDGEFLHGHHNVCRHRAGCLAVGAGKRKSLQCRYHGWTYDLAGALVRAPEMESARGFDRADYHLYPVRVATWGPLVFACLDPLAPSLDQLLEDIPQRAARHHIEQMRYSHSREYVIACNWKVYVDNYLEGYHIPVAHPGLYKEIDYPRYEVVTSRYSSRQVAPIRPVVTADSQRRYIPDGEDEALADYFWIFPNLMLNLYFGQLQTNLILPRGPQETLVIFDWYSLHAPTVEAWERHLAFSEEIQREDIAICESVQKNLAAGIYDQGRFCPTREVGVHHFHGLVRQFLVGLFA
jgi:choline monooxygenase